MVFLDDDYMIACKPCTGEPKVEHLVAWRRRGVDALLVFKDILLQSRELPIEEEYIPSITFRKIVFASKHAGVWNGLFTKLLGKAAKPVGQVPSKEERDLTRDFGGIETHQTLYKKEFESTFLIAMIWPWADGDCKSARIVIVPKESVTKS